MKMLTTCLFGFSVLGAIAITGVATAETSDQPQAPPSATVESPAQLTATRCLICHGNVVPGKGPLAPRFMMVKMHYGSLDEEAFVKTVSSWVKAPDKAKSKLPAMAIDRFGLMPVLAYPEAEVTAIAHYIYQTDFAMPGHGGPGMNAGPKAAGGCADGCGPSASAAPKAEEHCATDKPIPTSTPAAPKWPIPAEMMNHLQSLDKDIGAFESSVSEDHANLAKRTEQHLTALISSCTMEGDAHTALHEWLVPFRELAKQHADAVDPSAQQEKVLEMRRSFTAFHEHFEAAPQP